MGGCFSSPAGATTTTSGLSRNPPVLFFPDAKMPCRAFLQGKPCKRGASCNFAHETTSLSRLLEVINGARQTLDVCVFTITCNEIADAVIDAKKRGVVVRVISDDEQAKSQGSDLGRIGKEIEVRTDADPVTHMHHKFAIVDKVTLINGSFNWTRQAVLGNQENIVIQTDFLLCHTFQKQFDKMWLAYKANRYVGR
mmetsp:Transcript_40468/g.100082  ORF Transcript_40468/g.100082 Transcript_40468/m.100082 type:complete len:196 (+) Transcript_40468:85-672(+)